MPEVAINTFEKGLFRDVHPDKQPKGTVRDSLNGRILYKGDGSFAWSNEKGTRLAASLPDGYTPLGYATFINKSIIFSRSGSDSEIGQLIMSNDKKTFTYETLFNDKFDPYSEKLNFSEKIKAIASPETSTKEINQTRIERVYWADDINPIRSFNIALADDAKNDIVKLNDPTGGKYPNYYSIHNMELQAQFTPGIIEFSEHTNGSLLSGHYQYTYQLITKDGYDTPWIPATRPMVVTDTSKVSTNWHIYRMKKVGVSSGKGIKLRIHIEDSRFEKFRVAYIYTKTKGVPEEANIFFEGKVGDGLLPGSTTIHEVEHKTSTGIPIAIEELPQRFIAIEKAKTIETKDNMFFAGNIEELNPPLLSPDKVRAINIRPHFRFMASDEEKAKTSTPFTHQNTVTSTMFKSKFLDRTKPSLGKYELREFPLSNDYKNYKGTQTDIEFTGYFRGETYRVGILFYDKIGNPSFTQHVMDITMPGMYESKFNVKRFSSDGQTVLSEEYYLTTEGLGRDLATKGAPGAGSTKQSILTDGLYKGDYTLIGKKFGDGNPAFKFPNIIDRDDASMGITSNIPQLRIMGLWVDNIDITDIKDQISGFSIVVAPRDKRLIAQGLMLPAIDNGSNETVPLPTNWNLFTDDENGNLRNRGSYSHPLNLGPLIRPKTFTFESPDAIKGGLGTKGAQDRIQFVGAAYATYKDVSNTATINDIQYNPDHHYVKAYHTYTPDKLYHNKPRDFSPTTKVDLGKSDTVTSFALVGVGIPFDSYNKDNTSLIFTTTSWDGDYGIYKGFSNIPLQARHHPGTVVMVLDSFSGMWPYYPGLPPTALAYTIGNYIRPTGGTYGGISKASLAETIYEHVGHFQPIDSTVLNKVKTGSSYIVDGVEVWGGDCYLDYWDYCRHTPQHVWKPSCKTKQKSNLNQDYGIGMVFPVESERNYMLHRTEESFGEVGTQPQSTAITGSGPFLTGFRINNRDGCKSEKLEDFTTSAIDSYIETVFTPTALPVDFKRVVDFPYRWIWSQVKNYGEEFDNFRKFLPADFKDIDARFGEIIASTVISENIYSWQESGFGKIYVNERAAVTTLEGSPLRLGTGGVFERFDYMSKKYGCQHQFGLVSTSMNAYWPDVRNGKICGFGQDGFSILSDDLGLHDLITNTSKDLVSGDVDIHGVFDIRNSDIYITFIKKRDASTQGWVFISSGDPPTIDDPASGDPLAIGTNVDSSKWTILNANGYTPTSSLKSYQAIQGGEVVITDPTIASPSVAITICYNEKLKKFTSMHSFIPSQYITVGDTLFSDRGWTEKVAYNLNEVWQHNEGKYGSYFGMFYNSFLEFVVNDAHHLEKIFDNLITNLSSEGNDIIKRIQVITQSGSQTLTFPDDRARFREDFLRIPLRELKGKTRARGTSARIRIEFENRDNKRVLTSTNRTKFRISRKI